MKIIPINIALIPPADVINLCVDIHADSRTNETVFPELGKIAVPHLTLAQLLINQEDIPVLKNIIKDLWSKYERIKLKITSLNADFYDPKIGNVLQFDIEKSEDLIQLQSLISDLAKVYAIFDCDPKQVLLADNASKSEHIEFTLEWIIAFLKKDQAQFNPHITLGLAKLNENMEFSLEFAASELAIYQLGSFCTCQKLL